MRRRFDSLEFTRRFERAYASLDSARQAECDRAIRALLEDPGRPGLRLKPIQPTKTYWEARLNRGDRLIIRPAGSKAYLIDVVPHDEIQRYG